MTACGGGANATSDTALQSIGAHVATIGFHGTCGVWQNVVVHGKEMELSCASKEVAFAAWHDEFDPETGFPKSTSAGSLDA